MTDREFPALDGTRDTPARMTCFRCKVGTAEQMGTYAGAAVYHCPVCLGGFTVARPEQACRRSCGCLADPRVFGHTHA